MVFSLSDSQPFLKLVNFTKTLKGMLISALQHGDERYSAPIVELVNTKALVVQTMGEVKRHRDKLGE